MCSKRLLNRLIKKSFRAYNTIRRFELTLIDGTVLPVPDRKYAKVAKALQEWGK